MVPPVRALLLFSGVLGIFLGVVAMASEGLAVALVMILPSILAIVIGAYE